MKRLLIALILGLLASGRVNSTLAAPQGQQIQAQAEPADDEQDEAPEEEDDEMETDRDSFTPASSTVSQGFSILETSYSFIDNRDVAETHSFPETLVRLGVWRNLELRIGWNYEVGGASSAVSGNSGAQELVGGELERESQVLYGFKAQMTQQDGWIPRSAVILQGFTPTSGEAPETDVVAGYIFGWRLPNSWRIDSAMRYGTEHGPDESFNVWAPSVVLSVPLTDRWKVHAEYFGVFTDGAEREFSKAFFSPGTHYLIADNVELGVRVGWGLTDEAANFFSNIGIGWRY